MTRIDQERNLPLLRAALRYVLAVKTEPVVAARPVRKLLEDVGWYRCVSGSEEEALVEAALEARVHEVSREP